MSRYYLYRSWGRVGEDKDIHLVDQMDTKESAKEQFNTLYEEKIKAGYVTVEIDYGSVSHITF